MHTFDLLQPVFDKVPAAARMVAYQMHERCNGSGYPRGRTGGHIHDLAKISAVADVFIALASPRPHRHGMRPYHAMVKLLHDVREGLFDGTVVRALLQTVSLFPLGSYVALSDGRTGKVIRSNGEQYTRPVVEFTSHNNPNMEPLLVDLSQETDLQVVGAVAHRLVE